MYRDGLKSVASFFLDRTSIGFVFLPYLLLGQSGPTATPVFQRTFENAINGAKIGESSTKVFANGDAQYDANIRLGSLSIQESLETKSRGGKVSQYTFSVDQAGTKSAFTWDGKNLSISSGKTPQTIPFPASQMPEAWFANYMAGVHDSFRSLKWQPGEVTQKIKVFLVDGQGVYPVTLTKLPNHPFERDGKSLVASTIQAEIASVKANLYFGPDGHFVGELVPSQHYTLCQTGVTGLFDDPIAKYPELSQSQYEVETKDNLSCTLRDGTKLIATALVPKGEGKWPVILVRTPYGRALSIPDEAFYASRGYAVIVQDVRGTGDSGGKFDPFVNEIKDGYDTVQWAAHLPFANGKVGMIGASYLGCVQWQAAVADPPALKCIVPQVSPPDAFHNLPYEYGCFLLYPSLWWGNIVKSKDANLELAHSSLKNPKGLLELPLTKVPEATLGAKIPFFNDWLKRDGLAKWKGFDFESYLLKAKVPALQISGWWDGDGIGTDLHWLKMRAAHRTNQWLIEGPWIHAFNTATQVDDQNYGPQSLLDLDPVYLRFFDHYLKGKEVGWLKQPKVRYFVMGQNQWHLTSDFPDHAAHLASLYLDGHHRLASSTGTGSESYHYNPAWKAKLPNPAADPMSTKGGLHFKWPQAGRGLYFETKPFPQDTIIEGPYGVDLWVKIDCPTTDLYAALVKISPSGKIEVIDQPGKLNLSYLNGLDRPRNLLPGRVYKAHLFPWISAVQFKKGDKLGLAIASSGFPLMARNLNTGQPLATGTKMRVVKVTILHDHLHPSRLTFYKLGG